MRLLIYTEPSAGSEAPLGAGLLAKARQLGAQADAVTFSAADDSLRTLLGRYGASRIFRGPATAATDQRADALARLIIEHTPDLVLLENSAEAADLAGRLAARLEAGVNWDLSDLDIEDGRVTGTRLALGDGVVVTVGWRTTPGIGVFRRGAAEPSEASGTERAELTELSAGPADVRLTVIRQDSKLVSASSLDNVRVIVAGGRGVKSAEDIALLEELAAALSGKVAVSMPLVDRGWYPHSRQVGMTGRTVKPQVYIACGISGATAHRVGIASSSHTVAINSDASAPIFRFCDLGIVGDLYEVVPLLANMIRQRDVAGGSTH